MEHDRRVLNRSCLKRLAKLNKIGLEEIINIVNALNIDGFSAAEIFRRLTTRRGINTHCSGKADGQVKEKRIVKKGSFRRKRNG